MGSLDDAPLFIFIADGGFEVDMTHTSLALLISEPIIIVLQDFIVNDWVHELNRTNMCRMLPLTANHRMVAADLTMLRVKRLMDRVFRLQLFRFTLILALLHEVANWIINTEVVK